MVEEEAIRHLKKTFAEPSTYRKASAAYHTLLRVANLKGVDEFEERIGSLADDMGYAYNDAHAALQLVKLAGLCDIKVQTIQGSKERGPSVYTVKRRLPDFRGTLPDKRGTLPGKRGRLPESPNVSAFPESTQELPQERPNNHPKRGASPAPPRFVPPTVIEAEEEAVKLGMPKDEGRAFVDHHETRGWILKGGQKMKNWRAGMGTWKRNFEKFGKSNGNGSAFPPPFGDRRSATRRPTRSTPNYEDAA